MTEEVGGILTLDTETTMKNTVGNNKASAFCPDNYIVMAGVKYMGNEGLVLGPQVTRKSVQKDDLKLAPINLVKVLIGQNIKFDIHHARKQGCSIYKTTLPEWLVNNKIWDIQLAEYILTGQESKYASLDDMAKKYGLPVKDSKVSEAFAKGIGADGIDEQILAEYLKQDINNTEAIAFKQMQEAYDRKKLPLIEAMMDALMAVEDMEYNGLAIDLPLLAALKNKAKIEVSVHEMKIMHDIMDLVPILKGQPFNIDSNKQLSAILFGGEIEFDTTVPVLLKNGKTRNKHTKETITIAPVFNGNIYSTPNANGFKIDEEVLSKIESNYAIIGKEWHKIIIDILARKKIKKELNTYYEGLSELIFPDGLIHHNINLCATETGRPSSNNPNSQNIPSSEESQVKKLFVSRWGKDGCIISVDYKQIEIIALAHLSQDKQLVEDIINGVDVHTAVGIEYYGNLHLMSEDERRVIKTVNFGLIYGGTANALASQAGIPASEVKKIINAFYTRYPGVKIWQDKNINFVHASRGYDGTSVTTAGYPSGIGFLASDTGRVYTFHEKDNPFKPGTVNFKPTEIKNYPVQGFATGDLVLTMVGVLWRKLKLNPKLKDTCLMVNLVHDEIVFDCKWEVYGEACKLIKNVLENTPKYLKDIYNIDFKLPTKVKVCVGDNWKEKKEVDL